MTDFLTELERLNAAATKGPWKTGYMDSHAFLMRHADEIAELVKAADGMVKSWDSDKCKEFCIHLSVCRKALANLNKEKS